MTKGDVYEVRSMDVDVAPSDGHALITTQTNRGTIVLSMTKDVLLQLVEQASLAQSHKDKHAE